MWAGEYTGRGKEDGKGSTEREGKKWAGEYTTRGKEDGNGSTRREDKRGQGSTRGEGKKMGRGRNRDDKVGERDGVEVEQRAESGGNRREKGSRVRVPEAGGGVSEERKGQARDGR